MGETGLMAAGSRSSNPTESAPLTGSISGLGARGIPSVGMDAGVMTSAGETPSFTKEDPSPNVPCSREDREASCDAAPDFFRSMGLVSAKATQAANEATVESERNSFRRGESDRCESTVLRRDSSSRMGRRSDSA